MSAAAAAARTARRPATLLLALVLLLTALVLPNVPAVAAPDETFADDFQSYSFAGSTGSLPWAGPWIETGESDGVGAGSIQVRNEPHCETDPCLTLGRAAGPDATVEREADLGRFVSATLTFDYKIHQHFPGAGTAALKVSGDGGGSWYTLETWSLAADSGPLIGSYDISDYIAADTRILFAVAGSTDDSHMNIDNLEIGGTGAMCYLVGDNSGVHRLTSLNLSDLDPLGAEVTIGDTGANLRAIALDPFSGDLFAATADQLHTVDTATGAVSTIGSFGSSGPTVFNQIETLTFDPTTGVLYASHYRPGDLDLIIQVDPATGSAVADAFGAGIDYVTFSSDKALQESLLGLAIDATGQMWGMGWNGDSQERLHYIDKTTGSGVADFNSQQVSGLTYDPQGTLWALDPVGEIFEMRLSANSRDIDNLTNYSGIACQIPPPPINQAPVFDQDLLDRTDAEGTFVSITSPATDPDIGDTLTYTATGLPEGISIDPTSGGVSGALGANSSGTHSITITVTDDGAPNLQDTDVFTWTVVPGEVTYLVANTGGANGGDDLLTVVDRTDPDPVTNEVNIGTGTGTSNIEAAALQPGTNVLFAVENDQLGTINVTNGVFTPRPSVAGAGNGPVGLIAFDNIEGLSFNPFTGELFGTHRRDLGQEDLLFRFDPDTGSHVAGAFGGDDYIAIESQWPYHHASDLGFDPTDGQLYLVHWDLAGNWSLATVDPLSGATTTKGVTPDDIVSLAFDETGRVYTSTETGGAETLYELNKADGSVLSSIVIDNGSNYEAMAIAFPVEPNQPPSFDQDLLDRTDPEGTIISLSSAATDPDGGNLTYAATGFPPGLSIDGISGLISGTIGFAATGTYAVEITATDNGIPNLDATDTFTWTVIEANQPPVFDQDLPNRIDAEGSVISLSAAATDPDIGDTLTYGTAGLPPGLSMDPGSGLITGTIDYTAATASPYAVTITVIDNGTPNESAPPDTFTWTVSNTNRDPVITNPGAQTTPELAPFSILITASDPDGQIPSFSDGATLPAWAVLTDNLDGTATVAGTPGAGDSGTTTVTVTASDGGVPNLSDDAVFDITVTNTNLPPTITNPGNQFGSEATPFSLVVTASDPDGTTASFSDGSTLPAWATLTDNGDNTATIAGTPGYADAAITTVTITASDGSLSDDAIFDISIANTNRAPVVDPIADQLVAENDPFSLVVTASDPDGTIPSLTATGLPGWATLLDNGNGTATISGTPGFGDAAVTTVTITANDGALPGSETFDLTVTNVNLPPTIDPVTDRTVAEGAALPAITVISTDPDGTFPSLAATGLPGWASFVDNGDGTATITGTPGYDDAAVTTVTINAEDGGVPNLADLTAFDITVTDTNRPPVFNQDLLDRFDAEGVAISFSAAATDPDLHELSYSATGLPPGLGIDPLTGQIAGTISYTASGFHSVQITVTDDGIPSQNAMDDFVWTVTNTNRPPVLDAIGDQFGVENTPFGLLVTASDPDGAIPTLVASGVPAWATFVDNGDGTATLNGTPGFGDAAVSTITVTASDGSLVDDEVFDLTVTDSNRPPVVDPIANQTVAEGDAFSLTVSASDPDGTIPMLSASGLPGWAGLLDNGDGTATITGTPGYSDAAVTTVTVNAEDGGVPSLTTSKTFELTVTDTNQAPEFAKDLQDRTDAEGSSVSLAASATDPDLDGLVYAATGLPTGLNIDPTSGLITGTIEYTAAGVHAVEITVTDDGTPDLAATDTFTWTVTNVNRPPVLSYIGDQFGVEETLISFTAVATDPDLDDLTFSVAGAPTGATIDPNTGVFSWTPGEVHGVGSYAVTVTVADEDDPALTDSKVVTITVDEQNLAPVIAPITDQFSGEGSVISLAISASDPDLPANTLGYSAIGLPPGLSIDPATGLIDGTIELGSVGTYPVMVAVTDNASTPLLATANFTWKVTDNNKAPVVDPIDNRSGAELTVITFDADATDPDGDKLSYDLSGEPPDASINPVSGVFSWTPDETQGPGSYTITVLVTDDGSPSLTTAKTVSITVFESNQAPTIADVADQLSDEGDLISLAVVAEDLDLPANTLTFNATGLPPGLSIEPETGLISGVVGYDEPGAGWPHTVEVTVTDDADPALSATTTFTWTVTPLPEEEVNEAPIISPIDDQFTDENTAVVFLVAATDADPIVFAALGLPPGLAIDPTTGHITGTVGSDAVGTHRVTVSAIDGGEPSMASTVVFNWTVINVAAAAEKEEILVALDGFEETPTATDKTDDSAARPIRRSLVVMSSAAAATTEALSWPLGLLLALLVGFATVGRVGLYPLLWRGDRHTGSISFYDPELNFGLIEPDEGGEAVFVHAHAFPRRLRPLLAMGMRVRYRVLASDNRSSAWGATMERDHE